LVSTFTAGILAAQIKASLRNLKQGAAKTFFQNKAFALLQNPLNYKLNSLYLREALFIKKNKERWERIQHKPSADADEMARDFVQLVDDLAYAKTFYPAGKVTPYINSQASNIYLGIYQNRKEENNRLVKFWKYDVPLTMRKHHGIMLAAFIIFILFFSIGFFSSENDPDFVRSVLSDDYVEMTKKNIENGNPLGVYQSGNPLLTWLGIMINNIYVSLRYFVQGLFFGFFSIKAMCLEAIRIGAFFEMFFSKGLGITAAMGVLIHGLLELTAIIIACGAGVVLGKSVLFPGTIKRIDALKQGAKDGVKIVIGLVPVFIVAAFFEGFVTRYYKMDAWINWLILGAAFIFIVWYFIIYPIRLQKKLSLNLNAEEV
jgi:uncharacterized membrane protein SpoIIM required for sporulation